MSDLRDHRICNADYGRVTCYCSALDWMTLDQYGEHIEAVVADRLKVEIHRQLGKPNTCEVWRADTLIFSGRDFSADLKRGADMTTEEP